jgi:hypothetical protein
MARRAPKPILHHVTSVDAPKPSPETLAERDTVLSRPVSREQELFGDPPIGRRAIDKPKVAPPKRWREPIDCYKLARLVRLSKAPKAADGQAVQS